MRTTITSTILLSKAVINSLFNLSAIPLKLSLFRIKLILLFVNLWMTIPLIGQNAQNNIQVISGTQTQKITNISTFLEHSIEVFKDEKGNTTFEEVAANDALFGDNNTRGNFESDKVYWMKLNLQAEKHFSDTCFFFINGPGGYQSWEKIVAYLIHEDGRVEKQQTGYGLTMKEKAIPVIGQAVGFGLDSAENARLYIKVKGVRDGRVPDLLSMVSLHKKDFAYYFEYEYQFKGKFELGNGKYDPFRYNIIDNIQLLESPDSMTSFEDLLVHQEDWKWDDDILNILPKKDKVYWMKTQLIGTKIFNGEQILQVFNKRKRIDLFDYVDIYISKNKEDYSHQRTGLRVPLNERPYEFWANFFKIELQDSDTLDLYIRMKGWDGLPHWKSSIRLVHIDPSSLFPRQVNEAAFIWFSGGIFVTQFVFFLFLFFIEKDQIHFYFAMLIFGFFLNSFFFIRIINHFLSGITTGIF